MLKLKWYIVLGVVTYILVVIANIPASFVVEKVDSQLRQAGVELSDVTGSVWDGAANMKIRVNRRPLPSMFVDWQFEPWRLLLAQVSLGYAVEGQGFKLEGSGRVSPGTLTIADTDGKLSSALINQFSKEQGAEISGQIELKELNLEWDLQEKRAIAAAGGMHWGGGKVSYRQAGYSDTIDFPAVKGDFTEKEGSLLLTLADAKQGKKIASVEVPPTGWAKVSVMKRVLELAGQMKVGKDGDKPVFEVQQKLF